MKKFNILTIAVLFLTATFIASLAYCQDDDSTRNVLKQGLLGAGTGAIASGASGGNAGTGALIGAGTGVIGGALLDAITTPSSSSRPVRKVAARPVADDEYYDDQGDEYYEEPAQESSTQKVLKQGLLGAGTGAIAAGASGGNAGQGALIGAGTGVIGGALLDAISQPSQPKRVYRRTPRAAPKTQSTVTPAQNVQVSEESAGPEGGRKKIIKKYDASGKLVSEEETYY
ncbi:MAG: glycine zipper family protein [Candidatus Omnitrophica bacterium]|nr:glycine zipper family protein [Candidatus Omnitrophota bacterium]